MQDDRFNKSANATVPIWIRYKVMHC